MDHAHHAHLAMLLADIDPLAMAGFIAVFSFSFMASLHCALMCAPLVCALLGQSGSVSRTSVVLYNSGRFVSYVSGGAIFGTFGAMLLQVSAAFGYGLALVMAFLLFISAWNTWRAAPGTTGSGVLKVLLKPLAAWLARLPSPLQAFGLGLITVVFPCMTLTPVLAIAAASASTLRGAALLAAFQAGTLAVMVIAPLVPNFLGRGLGFRTAPKVAAFFLLLAGAATVFRLLH